MPIKSLSRTILSSMSWICFTQTKRVGLTCDSAHRTTRLPRVFAHTHVLIGLHQSPAPPLHPHLSSVAAPPRHATTGPVTAPTDLLYITDDESPQHPQSLTSTLSVITTVDTNLLLGKAVVSSLLCVTARTTLTPPPSSSLMPPPPTPKSDSNNFSSDSSTDVSSHRVAC
jgi:hypothetical protein